MIIFLSHIINILKHQKQKRTHQTTTYQEISNEQFQN